jgi:hypothetical protein
MNPIADLEKQAVKAALSQSWQQAVDINNQILKESPANIGGLNRLGLALSKLGQTKEAKQTYNKVLELDRQNQIAVKSLERLDKYDSSLSPAPTHIGTKQFVFIEEPGKTKVVKLVRLAAPEVLVHFSPGDTVNLLSKTRTISIETENHIYLGTIPEDLSLKLLSLIKGGNLYEAFIKAVDPQNLNIFIRETFRSHRFHNRPSFTVSSSAPLAFLEERPVETPLDMEDEMESDNQ